MERNNYKRKWMAAARSFKRRQNITNVESNTSFEDNCEHADVTDITDANVEVNIDNNSDNRHLKKVKCPWKILY